MEDFEARRALAAARAELGRVKPTTAKSIIAENIKILRIGLAENDSATVIAKAIKNHTGCSQEPETLEREIRKLPEFREVRGRVKKAARAKPTRQRRPVKAIERPTIKPQLDLRNIDREGWN